MRETVLVLNANFEPIHVTNVRRAIKLVLGERAFLVMNGRGVIRTVTHEYPIPSIIRLSNMISKPRQPIHLSKKEVFERDQYTCQYCGSKGGPLTVDHVIPRHLGGLHVWENVVAACPRCNHLKGGKTLEEAHMSLRKPPKSPPQSAAYRFKRYLQQNHEWSSYIEFW
ncbi:MAG: HNH endonuclease [Anaerolineaceae bacterium]|jgi:5-methylcytosine-specific restriction endonuclease McrA